MLSRTAEYAVRALVVLARGRNDAPVNAAELAILTGAPKNYLSKTLNVLVRNGLLSSTRGPTGGFAFAHPPERMTIAMIADLFADTPPRGARCLLRNQRCDPLNPCVAHRRWSAMTAESRAPLLRTTIGELCEDSLHHGRG